MSRSAQATAVKALLAEATIQRVCARKDAPGPICAAEERLQVQPKLSLGRPDDRYEQEADRIADQVTAARTVPLTGPLPITPLVQRQVEDEEEEEEVLQPKTDGAGQGVLQRQADEEEEEVLQPKIGGAAPVLLQRQADEEEEELLQPKIGSVGPTFLQRQAEEEEEELVQPKTSAGRNTQAAAAAGQAALVVASGGHPLPPAARGFFERRFGRDLSRVRVHTSGAAQAAARGIGARAYTLGRNIAFAPGQYAPNTRVGQHLMAHELTHTIQQAGGGEDRVQRTESGGTWGGFWRNIGAAFAIGAYFSDEDIEAYLDQIAELAGPAGDYDSDNKALEVAKRINQGFPLFGHEDTVELRKILILEMQAGWTRGDEEEEILGLMTSLDALEIPQLFRGPNALIPEDLRGDIHGDNRDRLDIFFNAMGIACEGMEARPGEENCTEEERTAVRESVALSQADIDTTIGHLRDAPESSQVRHSFFLAFRVDAPSSGQTSDMTARLGAVRRGTDNAHYICDRGEEPSSLCNRNARGYSSVGPSGRGIGLCFMARPGAGPDAAHAAGEETEEEGLETDRYNLAAEEDDAVRSMLITHEAAHFYLGVDDNGYFTDTCHETNFAMTCLNGTRENCGTSGRPPDDRFDNADSYACFVHYLARLANFRGGEREGEEREAEEETLESRAEALRGGNLEIHVHYPESLIDVGNDIYLNDPPGTEVFVMIGEPEHSGFTHDWAIDADGERLPLTLTTATLRESDAPRQMRAAAEVPSGTKERLRTLQAAGTNHVEVAVRTTIYRGAPEETNVETRRRVRLESEEADLGIF